MRKIFYEVFGSVTTFLLIISVCINVSQRTVIHHQKCQIENISILCDRCHEEMDSLIVSRAVLMQTSNLDQFILSTDLVYLFDKYLFDTGNDSVRREFRDADKSIAYIAEYLNYDRQRGENYYNFYELYE